jgi:hypothetical protein
VVIDRDADEQWHVYSEFAPDDELSAKRGRSDGCQQAAGDS